ncbi:MAG TPA: fructosamine kinase family protein [Streptomyces sp.]|nr:fructosamine kinase family protein [Streptomyces sp.]
MLGATATGARPVGGGDICDAHRITLADGQATRTVLAKTREPAPEGFFTAEATGLELLRSTGTVAVPGVLAAEPDVLVLEWVEPGRATAAQAERLGRELAALHATPARAWGNPVPGRPAYLGPIPLPSPAAPPAAPGDWPAFHAGHRLLPLLRRAVETGGITAQDARDVELLCERIGEVAGEPQPPAVIHGDLWSGNVLWSADGRARLIDPAAQGGHPETDLALLELFGCPHLDRLLAAYEEVRPVPGRRQRVPLHQLQHLLVHAVLFGSGYGARCGAAARAALGRD